MLSDQSKGLTVARHILAQQFSESFKHKQAGIQGLDIAPWHLENDLEPADCHNSGSSFNSPHIIGSFI